FFFVLRPAPISPLFPYTTLFRSLLGEFAISFCGSHSTGRVTGRSSNGPGGLGRLLKKAPSLICSSLDDGSQSPWLSMTNSSPPRSEEHTSELQSRENLVCRLLLE